MNRLLTRQIKRKFGDPSEIPSDMAALFKAISRSYDHYEEDRVLLNRAMDISYQELEETANQLKIESELTKKSLKQLDEFAYIVSHDLKAPLRSIGSLSDWLITDYSDKLDEEGREYLSLLQGRVRRMHSLIEGVLEYSRIGRVEAIQTTIDLNDLVGDLVDMHRKEAKIVLDPLPSIKANEVQTRQIFQNLIGNAIKHNDKDIAEVHIACSTSNDFHTFTVSDNGPGIPEQYHDKIFMIFQTLTSRDNREGTGVGLTIVKKILDTLGGDIWMKSEEGQGTTFYFTIPKFN